MAGLIPAAKPYFGPEEREAVDRVLRSGMVAQGPEVAAFEEEFSAIVAGREVVAVNAGTSGLHLALLAMGVGPGDEVIVPSFSFAATANVVALVGATPVFVDIEPDHFAIDPAAVEAAITPKTTAIMPVHLYGHPADMDRLGAIAARHGLAIIEDACQAHAAALDGTPVGAFGKTAVFSLYPTKNMTSIEGGMVVTDDAEVARKLRLLRNQGMLKQYENEVVGFNMRMSDVHAAVGRVQLGRLAGWTAQRQANAAYLDAGIAGSGIVTPPVAAGATHVYHQYTVRVSEQVVEGGRDAFATRLRDSGVGCGVYYPIPIHRLPSFAVELDLPETERAAREVLSLPVHPALSEADLKTIVETVVGK
jgi:dTDP-4-amino-4,6-dideoxygalactose transaminase